MTTRILMCANPDLNFIDGSSIWSQTIALAIASTGEAVVDFIAKSTPERDELFGPLKAADHLQIIDGTSSQYWNSKTYKRLTLPMMADLAIRLDQSKPYDVIVIRGLEIATALLEHPTVLARCWIYLTDIPQALDAYSSQQRLVMQRLALGCHRVLCQTEGFKMLWQALAPSMSPDKVKIYSPVIPDLPDHLTPISKRKARAIYAGKFKGDWMTLEMAKSWPEIHRAVPDSELVMIGDKIHKEAVPADYHVQMQHALTSTNGLKWLGAQSREAVQQELNEARVGLSWRAENMNDTVEYSTKILEYGGAGCAVVLNRNPLHEKLLGHDYPLFANSTQEFISQLTRALTDVHVAEKAAKAARALAEKHTFSSRVKELSEWLRGASKSSIPSPKTRVLVAGHDLKFFALLQKKLEATGKFEFLIDQWRGHNKHDEDHSRRLLELADVIFCEWCLGNLKWYSHNKKHHQRLVARFHAQEVRLPYMEEAEREAIDHVSFVSEHTRLQALDMFPTLPEGRTSVIPNFLDDSKFTPSKKTGEAKYNLGIVGITPKSKRFDRAIDLLESLLEEDDRYCLRVKGKYPLEYDWLLKRSDELDYYRKVFHRINSSSQLRHRVVFDPPADDVNEWFRMVGYILSPSDFESFHMAIGEGMLTGTVPIIWDWKGAKDIWGNAFVIHSIDEAKKRIVENAMNQNAIAETLQKLSSENVVSKWKSLLSNGE